MHGTIYPIPDVFAATGLHFGAKTEELKRFQVIGERSSGTNFIKRMLGRNTPLKATEDLGWKHGYPHMLAIPEDLLVVDLAELHPDLKGVRLRGRIDGDLKPVAASSCRPPLREGGGAGGREGRG